MMGKAIWKLLLGIGLLVLGNTLKGQQSARHPICLVLPEVAIMDIEPNNLPINLQFNAPVDGGEALTSNRMDQSKWINYTSSINRNGSNRAITAQIANGGVPNGVELRLEASNFSGSGRGTHGQSSGSIALTTTPQTIINNIGRSFTGNGTGNGHQLTYSLNILDYSQLDAVENVEVTILFTITE